MDTGGPCFLRRRRINLFHERHIEGAPDCQTFRKDCRARKHRSMRSLLVLKERNLQPRLRNRDLLQFIKIVHLLWNVVQLDRVCQGEKSRTWADLRGVGTRRKLSRSLHLFWNRLSQLIHVAARQVQLADFFFQGHPLHQVIYSSTNRLLRIEIQRSRSRRLCGDLYRTKRHDEAQENQYPSPTAKKLVEANAAQDRHMRSLLL